MLSKIYALILNFIIIFCPRLIFYHGHNINNKSKLFIYFLPKKKLYIYKFDIIRPIM